MRIDMDIERIGRRLLEIASEEGLTKVEFDACYNAAVRMAVLSMPRPKPDGEDAPMDTD